MTILFLLYLINLTYYFESKHSNQSDYLIDSKYYIKILILKDLFATLFLTPAMGKAVVVENILPAFIAGSRGNLRFDHRVSSRFIGRLDKGEQVEVIKECSSPSVGGCD